MAYKFWEYFLVIERDLTNTTRFVEPNLDNFGTYSVEFARILLAASSEVDVLCKRLCSLVAASSSAENINDYCRIITNRYPKFTTIEVLIPRYELLRSPWEDWKAYKNPKW